MSSVDSTSNRSGQLLRFNPEPSFTGALDFKGVLNSLGNVASGMVRSAAGLSTGADIDEGYQQIIDRQIEVQQQMMLVSLFSNLEKTSHDTRMAPVRNVRVA